MKEAATTAHYAKLLYFDDCVAVEGGDVDGGWRARLVWNGPAGIRDWSRSRSVERLFVPSEPSGEDGRTDLLDPDFRPLGWTIDTVAGAAPTLCARLCHLVAGLHEAGWLFGQINPDTVWTTPQFDRLAFLPIGPVAMDTLLANERRESIVRLQPEDLLHPAFLAGEPIVASPQVDLYALGMLCARVLTGTPVAPDLGDLGKDAALPIEIVRRLIRIDSVGYETARGAALDFTEYASRLARGVSPDFPLGRQDDAPRLQMPAALLGRADELESLEAAYASARDRAAVAFVTGDPGVGKSRLVAEFQRIVTEAGNCFAQGKSDQFKGEAPMSSLSQALDDVAAWVQSQPPRLCNAWTARIAAALGRDVNVACALSRRFDALLGPVPPVEALPPLEARNRFVFAILRLFKAMARPRRPLCLLLDDMQWIDEASLELLDTLASDRTLAGVMFIGVYRDSEVGPDHPLSRSIRQQSRGRKGPTILRLAPLDDGEVTHFVGEALRRTGPEVARLSATLNHAAKGNPLFLSQILRSLVTTGLISYDFVGRSWLVEDVDFGALELDHDVVAVIVARLRFLSPECHTLLACAAMLGNRALSRETLAAVVPLTEGELRRTSAEAVDQGVFIQREDRQDEDSDLAFAHDRLQQAALELLPPDEIRALRRQVGIALIDAEGQEDPGLLTVAMHNLSAVENTITAPDLRLRLAALALQDGLRALDRLAFAEARQITAAGRRWLPPDAWGAHRDLTLRLYVEGFRAAYQASDMALAEALYAEVMTHTRNSLEEAEIIAIRVLLDTAARRYDDVWALVRSALRLLGEDLPRRAGMIALAREAGAITRLMRGRGVAATLGALPPNNDEAKRRAIEILARALPAIYFVDTRLMMLCGMRITAMSLRYGAAPQSATGYVIVGMGLASALGRFRDGHAWGRAAHEIAERGGIAAVQAKTGLILGGFLDFWRAGFESSQRLLAAAYENALAAGDHQYACYCVQQRAMIGFFQGRRLDTVLSANRRASTFVLQTRDPFAIRGLAIWTRACETLGNGNDPAQAEVDRAAFEALGNPTLIAYHDAIQARLALLFGDPESALARAEDALSRREALLGQIPFADAEFVAGCAAAVMMLRGGRTHRLQRRLAASLRRLRLYARNAPDNFTPHLRLLEALAATSARLRAEPLTQFEAAISAADAGGFLDVGGLAARYAAEVAGRIGTSQRIAELYRDEADARFARWGAQALLATPKDEPRPTDTTRSRVPGAITQALAQRGAQSPRVETLLAAATAEAGLAFGAYFAFDGEDRRLVATHADDAVASAAGASDRPEIVPEIVDFVQAHARDCVVEDVAADTRFALQAKVGAPRAVACISTSGEGGLRGALYLAGAGTRLAPETRRALRIAANEIADSLGQRELRTALDRRDRALGKASRRLVVLGRRHEELATFLPRTAAAGESGSTRRSEEQTVTAIFADVQDYTKLVEAHGASRVNALLEVRFSRFYDEITARGGDLASTLGDAVLAIFTESEDAEGTAARAVDTAVAIAAAAKSIDAAADDGAPSLVVNIGVETGPALIGVSELGAGTAKRRTFSVVGASVNVASRLAGVARNGEILIGGHTRSLLPQETEVRFREAMTLRNVAAPVDVFEVVAPLVADLREGT